MSRTVVGLERAWRIPKPGYITTKATSGLPAKGLRYEARVGKSLGKVFKSVELGQWYQYCDVNGPGICQPDILVRGSLEGKAVVSLVFECKLTLTEEAFQQLNGLYKPVVSLADGLPAQGIVITRNLTRWAPTDRVTGSLAEAVRWAMEGKLPILHWLDHTPMKG